MKYQTLVSSTTPSTLVEWFGQELENRGIDNVYARSILSLLLQDYVDVEPLECEHVRNRQLKVIQKYGGPENLLSVTKSKHQKWKTWGKKFLFTSSLTCCNAKYYDLERLKKKAAVDCLRTASDYANDIEQLIEELWLRLKNIKNINGETEDVTLRKVSSLKIDDSFFIPPSSPVDEIEKYFTAFPPLNGKSEKGIDPSQHMIVKNPWCGRCVLKLMSKPQSENALKSDIPNSNVLNKPIQLILPLKPIKEMFIRKQSPEQISEMEKFTTSFAALNIIQEAGLKINTLRQAVCSRQIPALKMLIWQTMPPFLFKHIPVPLVYLTTVRINNSFLTKIQMINLLECFGLEGVLKTFFSFPLDINEMTNFLEVFPFLFRSTRNHSFNLLPDKNVANEKNCKSIGNTLNTSEQWNSSGIEIHFRMSPLSDLLDYHPPNLLDQIDFCNSFSANLYPIGGYGSVYSEGSANSDNEMRSSNLPSSVSKLNDNEIHSGRNSGNETYVSDDDNNIGICESVRSSHVPSKMYLNSKIGFGLTSCFEEYSESESVLLRQSYVKGSGQLLLKKVLNIGKAISMSSLNSSIKTLWSSPEKWTTFPDSSIFSGEKSTAQCPFSGDSEILISSSDGNLKGTKFNRVDISPDFQSKNIDNSAVGWDDKTADETPSKRWLFHWGDNHKFISRTWQKDFHPNKTIETVQLNSNDTSDLSTEIKEDGDELLEGLSSLLADYDSTKLESKVSAVSVHSNISKPAVDLPNPSGNASSLSVQIPRFLAVSNDSDLEDVSDYQNCGNFSYESLKNDGMEKEYPNEIQDYSDYYESNAHYVENYSALSAFPDIFHDQQNEFYAEGGGWSLASDSFQEYFCDNSCEKSFSLSDLDLEKNGREYLEEFHQRRQRCISEADSDYICPVFKDYGSRKIKQKPGFKRRPCLYFLQGNCTDNDCNFSHDFSATTCRFWKEGSCFKGSTCPFLHGYVERKTNRDSLDTLRSKSCKKDLSYSLESEADFPSLSLTPGEFEKSEPINIIQAKGGKKKKKNKI